MVLNRVADDRYPDSACEVVYDHKQFSFYWDGKSDKPTDSKAWRRSKVIAKFALEGRYQDITKGATHYHADYVSPSWSLCLAPIRIGRHLFYKL